MHDDHSDQDHGQDGRNGDVADKCLFCSGLLRRSRLLVDYHRGMRLNSVQAFANHFRRLEFVFGDQGAGMKSIQSQKCSHLENTNPH